MSKLLFLLIIYKYSKLNFPDHVKDYDFKNLMTHMLDKNLDTRYSKFEDISAHIYFKILIGMNLFHLIWNQLIFLK